MNLLLKYSGKYLFFLFLLITGCGPIKQAIFLDPGFQPFEIREIALLPAIDLRIDKSIEVNLQDQIQNGAMKILEYKDYQVSLRYSLGNITEITEEDLKSGDPEFIRSLDPLGERWVMVLALIDVTTKLTFGSMGNAEVAGFLYDTENGKIVWRDKGIGRAGQGGLIGMAMVSAVDEEAISIAMNDLLSSIPKRSE